MLRELIRAGMDVARLNFSHGDQAYHGENIKRIRAAAEEVGRPVAILTDLQGPKLRMGEMENDGVEVSRGEEVVLTTRSVKGHRGELPVQYPRLPQSVRPGDRILIDDGLIELAVLATGGTDIHCRVVVGGTVRTNKGLNLPRAHVSIPAITAKDHDDLAFVLSQEVDWIALSFVRYADEVRQLKELVRQQSTSDRPTCVVAKIEKPEAVENINDIIAATDGVMVARGDLGVETSPEEVPMVQKMIIRKCNQVGKPVITATQMLDSMIRNPRPTRAEASDVANAILDGTDAIMLSGETAVGRYPLGSLRTMVRIAHKVEEGAPPRPLLEQWHPQGQDIAEAVAHASCETAHDLTAAAIVTPTVSGHTARMVAKYRPGVPIVAVTPSLETQRRLMLYWGVYPLLARRVDNTDQMIADAVAASKDHGLVQEGDLVVITAGAAGYSPGTTNLMKVQVVGQTEFGT